MAARIPESTRIMLIPQDEHRSREYVISRGMVIGLGLTFAVLTIVVATVLVTFGSISHRLWRAENEVEEVGGARQMVSRITELERELETTRELQARLLAMLGVEAPAGSVVADSLARAVTNSFSYDARGAIAAAAAEVMTPPPDLWPAAGHVTQEYIEGDIPAAIRPHHGIDIAGPVDSPVVAAGSGLVRLARWDDYLGNFVEIHHGFGYVTVYGHCSRLVVQEGDSIERGQVIGYLGNTGESSAPHLHFEIVRDGEAIDPRTVIPEDPPR